MRLAYCEFGVWRKNRRKNNDIQLRKNSLEKKGAWRDSKGDSEGSIVRFDKAVEEILRIKKAGTSH